MVTCKIWKFFFAAATILVTLISSWVVGRIDIFIESLDACVGRAAGGARLLAFEALL